MRSRGVQVVDSEQSEAENLLEQLNIRLWLFLGA